MESKELFSTIPLFAETHIDIESVANAVISDFFMSMAVLFEKTPSILQMENIDDVFFIYIKQNYYLTISMSSTSNIKVAYGGMSCPAPFSPYAKS